MELADILSNRLGLASNGEDLSMCRRNKHLMGEQVCVCVSWGRCMILLEC